MLARTTVLVPLLWVSLVGGSAACRSASARAPSRAPAASTASTTAWRTFTSADGGFSIRMPHPTRERRAHDGPVMMHLVTSEDEHGTTYEATYFDIPAVLEAVERKELLEKVQIGLTNGPGVSLLERRDIAPSGLVTRELVLSLPEDHAGTWRIFYVGQSRMFQLSVTGKTGGPLDSGTAAFFASFRLLDQGDGGKPN